VDAFKMFFTEEVIEYSSARQNMPGQHSMDNTVTRFLERHFPEWVPPSGRKLGATKWCVMCYKKKLGRRQEFGVMNVRPVCVLRAASRPTTQAQVKSISFL
jgi:hypothetical protein